MRFRGTASLLVAALIAAGCGDGQTITDSGTPADDAPARASDLPLLTTASVVRGANITELPSAKQFDIQLRILAALSPSQEAIFRAAEDRWERLIVGDVPAISGTIPANFCGLPGVPSFTGTIDDIMIDVLVVPIDGPGQVLGAAGPCAVRFADDLPAYGIMFFDVADLGFIEQFDVLDEVILHEMGHVLGIGTLWNFNRMLRVGTGTPDPRFIGKHGVAMYRAIGGKGTIPVEGQFGPGTANGHWDEDTFDTELMTGFVGLGVSPLSRMTTTSLKDMGYVTATLGDPYELPSGEAALRAGPEDGIDLDQRELLVSPKGYIE